MFLGNYFVSAVGESAQIGLHIWLPDVSSDMGRINEALARERCKFEGHLIDLAERRYLNHC